MRILLILCSIFLITACNNSSSKQENANTLERKVVEASCGQCNFGMSQKGCDLAVRIDGQAYFVDGTGLDEHGDAHAPDGFCTIVRKASVSGEIVDSRFKATYFELLSLDDSK